VSLALLLWLTKNWWQVTRKVRGANASDELADALANARSLVGLRSCVRLKVVEDRMSPAVCGLIRPVILLPRTLLDNISAAQLRAVLLHEMFHLRRKDVWINCAQAFLQIAYWWHPLLWFANARIRRVREEAVDDAVMLALREDAETYAPTLLEVAKLALQHPLMSLGLVGIMESRSALRQRIERLVDFHAPRKAGLTFASLFGIFVFSAVALPMGKAPTPTAKQSSSVMDGANTNVTTMTFRLDNGLSEEDLKKSLLEAGVKTPPTVILFTANGNFFARGVGEQLALVNQVIQKLHGCAIAGSVSAQDIDSTSTNLFTRTFKVAPDVLHANLQRMGGNAKAEGAVSETVTALVQKFIVQLLGINLDSPAGKSFFYNDQNGVLLARATKTDLDVIEQAVSILNYEPPQINIRGRFAEVPENFFNSGTANPLPAGMTNGTGILTEVEARTLIQRLEAQPGADVLAMPNVTTLAGRQVQVRATQFVTALTNSVPAKNNSDPSITAAMQSGKIETGPVLDVIAEVLSDGYTIDLRTIASVTEFLGYADGTNMAPQAVTNSMPAVQLRTKAAHTQLYDGQTQVLFPTSEKVTLGAPDKQRDERVAEYIRQVEKRNGRKILVVFVTPTLTDPAAKRV